MTNKNELITIEDKEKIKIDNLVLDPNNPRFSKHVEELTDESKVANKNEQKETRKILEEEYEVGELKKSIRKNGYVPVDNVFVKEIPGKNKYVVVEGNRRIAAIKSLLEEHKKAKRKDREKGRLDEDKLNSMETIGCVDLTRKPDEDIEKILGLRHHGSIKEWEPLPASFDMYKQYMEALQKEEEIDKRNPQEFYYEADYGRQVADLYSVKLTEVRKKLRTYRVFIQLKNDSRVDEGRLENKFSIIHDSVNGSKQLYDEFEFNKQSCTFDEEGKDRFINLVFGENGQKPVIRAAASGDYDLRSFRFVLDKGGDDERRRIYEDRNAPANVKATIKDQLQEKNIFKALKTCESALSDIQLGSINPEKFSEAAKEKLQKVKKLIKRLDGARGKEQNFGGVNDKIKNQKSADKNSYIGKKPKAIIFQENRFEVETWREVLGTLSSEIYKRKDDFEPVLDIKGRERNYFTKDGSSLKDAQEIEGSPYYFEGNISAKRTMIIVQQLLTVFDYDKDSFEVKCR